METEYSRDVTKAVENRNRNRLRCLLRDFEQNNRDTSELNAAITKACELGCLEAARLLLEKGASMNEFDTDGWPSWHWTIDIEQSATRATIRDRFKCCGAFMSPIRASTIPGVNCDVQSCSAPIRSNTDAYFYHCTRCSKDVCYECLWKFRCEEKKSISRNDDGERMGLVAREIMIGYLLCKGANIDACDKKEKNSALLWAVNRSQPETVWLLLHHGIDPTLKNVKGQHAMDPALYRKNPQGMGSLVFCCTMREYFKRSDMDAINRTRETLNKTMPKLIEMCDDDKALGRLWPAECGKILLEIMNINNKKQRLLYLNEFEKIFWPPQTRQGGTNQAKQDYETARSIMFSASRGDGVTLTPLHTAVQMGYIEETKALLRMKATVDVVDSIEQEKSQLTPLMVCCGGEGGTINCEEREYSVKKLEKIHRSRRKVFENFRMIARLLIKHKACFGMVDKTGNTALHWLLKSGRSSVLKEFCNLHKEGIIDISVCDRNNKMGYRPIHYAVLLAHKSKARYRMLERILPYSKPSIRAKDKVIPSSLVCHASFDAAKRVRNLLQGKGFKEGMPSDLELRMADADECGFKKNIEEEKTLKERGFDSSARTCHLCGELIYGKKGLLIYEKKGRKKKKAYNYHLACIAWTPEVKWNQSQLIGVDKVIKRSQSGRLECSYCKKPRALLGCTGGEGLSSKQKTFHYKCAKKAKAKFIQAHDFSWKAIFCTDHLHADSECQNALLSSSDEEEEEEDTDARRKRERCNDGESSSSSRSRTSMMKITKVKCVLCNKTLEKNTPKRAWRVKNTYDHLRECVFDNIPAFGYSSVS
mmetsp:Transcript_44326/g.73938  ORF Transcript_44326/g.73938 Transcript_44326/m.73938 type:complete len:818 (+) Transcript_44326:455-2908(+)